MSAQPHLGVPSRALHGPVAKPRQHRGLLAIAGTAFLLVAGAGCWSPSLAQRVDADTLQKDSVAVVSVASDSIVSFPSPRVRAWQVGLVRGDRMEHASLSFALTSALIIATRNRAASAATAFAFGIGKELWDRRTGAFDPVDLTADAVGVGLATVLVTPHGP